jgi:hypothetical protein
MDDFSVGIGHYYAFDGMDAHRPADRLYVDTTAQSVNIIV